MKPNLCMEFFKSVPSLFSQINWSVIARKTRCSYIKTVEDVHALHENGKISDDSTFEILSGLSCPFCDTVVSFFHVDIDDYSENVSDCLLCPLYSSDLCIIEDFNCTNYNQHGLSVGFDYDKLIKVLKCIEDKGFKFTKCRKCDRKSEIELLLIDLYKLNKCRSFNELDIVSEELFDESSIVKLFFRLARVGANYGYFFLYESSITYTELRSYNRAKKALRIMIQELQTLYDTL